MSSKIFFNPYLFISTGPGTSYGSVEWLAIQSSMVNDYDHTRLIASDSSGNVYMTGAYSANPLTVYNSKGSAFATTSPSISRISLKTPCAAGC